MKKIILALSVFASAAFANDPTDGITSQTMLRGLIAGSGILKASELEHGKEVAQVPVELVIAGAISGGAQMSNSCRFVQKSRIISCVLEMKSSTRVEELTYRGTINGENGATIASVVYSSY